MSSGEAMMIHPLGKGYKRGKKVNIRFFFCWKIREGNTREQSDQKAMARKQRKEGGIALCQGLREASQVKLRAQFVGP